MGRMTELYIPEARTGRSGTCPEEGNLWANLSSTLSGTSPTSDTAGRRNSTTGPCRSSEITKENSMIYENISLKTQTKKVSNMYSKQKSPHKTEGHSKINP